MLLRIESCGPPADAGRGARARPCPAGPRGGGPAETRTGDTGGARSTIRVIRQRSSRSPPATGRPARRCGPRAVRPPALTRTRDIRRTTGARLTGGPPGRAGMGCWVRTAADGAAVRTPSDRRGAGTPAGPATVSGRQCVPAGAGGPVTGTLPRPADPATTPSGRTARRWPWRTLLAAAGGLRARPRVPRLRPRRPRGARPGRARARRPRPAVPLRPLARPGLRPGLLRAAAVLDRHLRRPRPVAGPRRLRGRATSRCSAEPRR